MKVTETNKCNYCPNNVDFVKHFFSECRIVKNFWKYLDGFILSSIGMRIKISLCDVMFGVHRNEQSTVQFSSVQDGIYALGKAPRLSGVFPKLPLKQFQCWSD